MSNIIVLDILDSKKTARASSATYNSIFRHSSSFSLAPPVIVNRFSDIPQLTLTILLSIMSAIDYSFDLNLIPPFGYNIPQSILSMIVIHIGLHGNKKSYIVSNATYGDTNPIPKRMLRKSIYTAITRLFNIKNVVIIDTSCDGKPHSPKPREQLVCPIARSIIDDPSQSALKPFLSEKFQRTAFDRTSFSCATESLMSTTSGKKIAEGFFCDAIHFVHNNDAIVHTLYPLLTSNKVEAHLKTKIAILFSSMQITDIMKPTISTMTQVDISFHKKVSSDAMLEFLSSSRICGQYSTSISSIFHSCDCCPEWKITDDSMYFQYTDSDDYGHFFGSGDEDSFFSMSHAFLSNMAFFDAFGHTNFSFSHVAFLRLSFILTQFESEVFSVFGHKQSLHCASRLHQSCLSILINKWTPYLKPNTMDTATYKISDTILNATRDSFCGHGMWFYSLRKTLNTSPASLPSTIVAPSCVLPKVTFSDRGLPCFEVPSSI